MNSVDNIAYNNGTLEKEFHYFTIKECCASYADNFYLNFSNL